MIIYIKVMDGEGDNVKSENWGKSTGCKNTEFIKRPWAYCNHQRKEPRQACGVRMIDKLILNDI